MHELYFRQSNPSIGEQVLFNLKRPEDYRKELVAYNNKVGIVVDERVGDLFQQFKIDFNDGSEPIWETRFHIIRKSDLQKYISFWSYKIFGTGEDRILPNAKHLRHEADELVEAIELGYSKQEIAMELADIVQLAYDIADREGIILDFAIKQKMDIVRSRKWLPPDADGIIRHVKEEEELK